MPTKRCGPMDCTVGYNQRTVSDTVISLHACVCDSLKCWNHTGSYVAANMSQHVEPVKFKFCENFL